MYCENELILIGSWIGAGFLGGTIMYWYIIWKLNKNGYHYKNLTKW